MMPELECRGLAGAFCWTLAEAGKMVSPALMALATSCWAACCRSSRPMRLSSSFIRATAFWADMPP